MKLITWQNACVGYLLKDGSIVCPVCAMDSEKDQDQASVPACGVERCDNCKRPLFEAKPRRVGYEH